ncbi:glycoside hydrolase family 5 protein [Piromyces sp. E2]|nr:glycoside hydrolase family 5 protein [Piromyces sp. E2]|eukprot:OUM56973.1 glycoside hydrolase family 5 protein [Piromyces sp. E2]
MKSFILSTICISLLLLKYTQALGFVKRCGDKFVLDNKTFYFTGSNNYYLHYLNTSITAEEVFSSCEKHGLNVMRTWAFIDKEYKDNEHGADGLQKMDQVVAIAEKHSIRLILTLTNNWVEFGGLEQWVRDFGYDTHDAFFTVPEIKDSFKKYVKTLINRTNTVTGKKYRDDGTIFAWELGNELRTWGNGFPMNKPYDTSILTNWMDEMSTYIKSLDPNHMVSTGEEGFGLPEVESDNDIYFLDDGNDFKKNAALPNIDFATIHLYPNYWNFKDLVEDGVQYIVSHANAAKKELNKPIVMEEFGVFAKNRDEVYPALFKTMVEQDFNGIMLWMLADHSYPDYDGFTIYDEDLTTYLDEFTALQKKKSGKKVICKKCKSRF